MLCVLTAKFHCLQEIPPFDPEYQGVKVTETRWESWLELAAAQPPP
jgi:hypothetical protein